MTHAGLRSHTSAQQSQSGPHGCIMAPAGDVKSSAVAVAQAVGIAEGDVHAGVRPGGKADVVRALQAGGRKVAMVGDGVNDASALAVADVGIAMGGGVDAASEAAAVVLLGDRLPQVGHPLFPGCDWDGTARR